MKRTLKVHKIWLWTLLALVVSYNLDLECFFESHSCRTQIVHFEPGLDCMQPGLTPAPVALIPTTPCVVVPIARIAYHVEPEWPSAAPPRPPCLAVPLGLRAPPNA